MGFLLEGLRIDEDIIRALPSSDIIKLMDVYKGKRERCIFWPIPITHSGLT
jgi:hypothetical protein